MDTDQPLRLEKDTRGKEEAAEMETDLLSPVGETDQAQDKSQASENPLRETQQETPQQRKEREDEEFEKMINEYAELPDQVMSQEMIDNDDLLEECEEQQGEIPENEKPDGADERDTKQIEALSQMSPEPLISKHKSGPKPMTKKETQTRGEKARVAAPSILKPQPDIRALAQNAASGLRRGARNQELKGAAASRKLASR